MRVAVLAALIVVSGCLEGNSLDECDYVEVVPPARDDPDRRGEFFGVEAGEPFTLTLKGYCGAVPESAVWHVRPAWDKGLDLVNHTAVGAEKNFVLDTVGVYHVSATPTFDGRVGADGMQDAGVFAVVSKQETMALGQEGATFRFRAFCCPGATGAIVHEGGGLPASFAVEYVLAATDGRELRRDTIPAGMAWGVGAWAYEPMGDSFLSDFTLSVRPTVVVPPGSTVQFCVGDNLPNEDGPCAFLE